MHQYDVALSFAGEQRSLVLDVAECLKKAGVNVFYDDYEKADLWGKNLYDHLSDVYQNKAKYCVIFASKEYAAKTWTNLERQHAQARALKDKGSEYILPVRFDSTDIPGLLDFKREGAAGVCSALLAKLGKGHSPLPPRSNVSLSCDLSPRALIGALNGKVAVPTVESCIWGAGIEVVVQGSENDSFFSHLRQEHPNVVVAYAFDVASASGSRCHTTCSERRSEMDFDVHPNANRLQYLHGSGLRWHHCGRVCSNESRTLPAG